MGPIGPEPVRSLFPVQQVGILSSKDPDCENFPFQVFSDNNIHLHPASKIHKNEKSDSACSTFGTYALSQAVCDVTKGWDTSPAHWDYLDPPTSQRVEGE